MRFEAGVRLKDFGADGALDGGLDFGFRSGSELMDVMLGNEGMSGRLGNLLTSFLNILADRLRCSTRCYSVAA